MDTQISIRSQCPNCLDSGKDNLITYADGKYCYACGYSDKSKEIKGLLTGMIVELVDRGISFKVCEKYNVRSKIYTGYLFGKNIIDEPIVIFPIYDNGKVVKQKIRSKLDKKNITQVGITSSIKMFGQSCFSPTKKLPVIITEGEYDAMSVYQNTGLPSISITRGAKGAKKEILANLEWLSQWKEVLLCFDNDETGKIAVNECLELFEPGLVKNIRLPLKDANEMVLADRSHEIKNFIMTAEIIKPSTLITVKDILEKILIKPAYGTPWPWSFMTKVTYGNRLGEVYMLAAAPSIGKTQIMYEIVTNHINNGCKVGLIDLERPPEQTIHRLISVMRNIKIYVPNNAYWDEEKIKEDALNLNEFIYLFRPESGKLSVESVLINIRYLYKAYGVSFFIIDNLTRLSVGKDNLTPEYEWASQVTGQFVQIAHELKITIFILNHLTKDVVQKYADITMGENFKFNTNKEGLTWETGRMPEESNIYGGKKVTALPDYLIVLARNRLADIDLDRRTVYVKFLKTRFESEFEGKIYKLIYDQETGKLKESY